MIQRSLGVFPHEGPFHQGFQLLVIPRLRKEIKGAFFHGFDGLFDGAETRKQNHFDAQRLGGPKQVESIQSRFQIDI